MLTGAPPQHGEVDATGGEVAAVAADVGGRTHQLLADGQRLLVGVLGIDGSAQSREHEAEQVVRPRQLLAVAQLSSQGDGLAGGRLGVREPAGARLQYPVNINEGGPLEADGQGAAVPRIVGELVGQRSRTGHGLAVRLPCLGRAVEAAAQVADPQARAGGLVPHGRVGPVLSNEVLVELQQLRHQRLVGVRRLRLLW